METATFGAGCFWGVEAEFRQIPGVKATAVGYMGGSIEDPTVELVAAGQTGHVEVVEIEYDQINVHYGKLLDVFWTCHDPTQMGRQGRDVGPQFRSVIFYHTTDQKSAAEHSRMMLVARRVHTRPVPTAITPVERFWPAAEDQQRYFQKRGREPAPVPPA